MFIVCVTEKTIYEYIKNLTISDTVKQHLHSILKEENKGYLDFFHDVFKYYSSSYTPLSLAYDNVTHSEAISIANSVKDALGANIDSRDILVTNRKDILYDNFATNWCKDYHKFDSNFYEYVYYKLMDVVTETEANRIFEDIITSIEHIVSNIETSAITALNDPNVVTTSENENMWLYVELKRHHLFLVYH